MVERANFQDTAVWPVSPRNFTTLHDHIVSSMGALRGLQQRGQSPDEAPCSLSGCPLPEPGAALGRGTCASRVPLADASGSREHPRMCAALLACFGSAMSCKAA